jgi:cytochrome c1
MKNMTAIFLIVLAYAGTALAQAPSVAVKSLYDSGSMAPGSLIPFEVSGTLVTKDAPLSAAVTESGGVDCRVMRDPHFPKVFLLKCAGEASVKLRFRVISSNKAFDVSYGPVTVKKLAGAGDPIIGDPVDSPEYLLGKSLYGPYCMGCHTVPSTLKGRSVETIKMAIAGLLPRTAPMKNNDALQTLNDQQIKAIETYLKKP